MKRRDIRGFLLTENEMTELPLLGNLPAAFPRKAAAPGITAALFPAGNTQIPQNRPGTASHPAHR